jgi:hypothetical protein
LAQYQIALEKLVSAEGIESARERKFNNMQAHGWHKTYMKSSEKPENGLRTDCMSTKERFQKRTRQLALAGA